MVGMIGFLSEAILAGVVAAFMAGVATYIDKPEGSNYWERFLLTWGSVVLVLVLSFIRSKRNQQKKK